MVSLGFFMHKNILINFVCDLFLFSQYIPPRFKTLILLNIIQCKSKKRYQYSYIIQRFFCLYVHQHQDLISQHSGEPKGAL